MFVTEHNAKSKSMLHTGHSFLLFWSFRWREQPGCQERMQTESDIMCAHDHSKWLDMKCSQSITTVYKVSELVTESSLNCFHSTASQVVLYPLTWTPENVVLPNPSPSVFFLVFFHSSLTGTIIHVEVGNLVIIWLQFVVMIIIWKFPLIKSGYHNIDHVEIWSQYFSFSSLFRAMLKFWLPYGYRMPLKKSLLPIPDHNLPKLIKAP
jgi:hypothetical protein